MKLEFMMFDEKHEKVLEEEQKHLQDLMYMGKVFMMGFLRDIVKQNITM